MYRYVVPVGECVDAFPDTFRVDVALADQTLAGLDHSFDPVQVQLHGGGEVLVFLYGCFNRFHCGGQLHVSKGRFLEGEDRSGEVMCKFRNGSGQVRRVITKLQSKEPTIHR